MEKIKNIVSSPIFTSLIAGGVGFALLISGNVLYAGIAIGVSVVKFIDALLEYD